jgi:hypothetical protein
MLRAPWVEIGSFDVSDGADADIFDLLPQRVAWRGVFACRLYFRPFAQLDDLRHGFNLDTLLTDALDRLMLYIETQNYPGETEPIPIPLKQRRAIALRCINDPESNRLDLVVMGRVYGASSDETYANAQQACREMCSTFPFDYRLTPIETCDEFHQLTGWEFISVLHTPEQMAELERFEGLVEAGQDHIYLAGEWRTSLAGNEQIWRTLAGMEALTLYNVTLQPVIVQPEDLAALQSICDLMAQVVSKVRTTHAQELVELATQRCTTLLRNGRRGYIGQARLMSASALPEYVPRAIGFGMTRQPEQQPATPGFEITRPEDLAELQRWKNQVLWLTPTPEGPSINRRFFWPRELILLNEAIALFRPPYPLKISPPGVTLDIREES